jgi:hypothetical protein
MAEKEMADYLSNVTADYTAEELTISPQHYYLEEGGKKQRIFIADDGSEERINFDNTTIFWASFPIYGLSASDAGIIIDLFHNTSKANGMVKSFYWQAPDNHTYTVRFASQVPRTIGPTWAHKFSTIRLRVLGNKP